MKALPLAVLALLALAGCDVFSSDDSVPFERLALPAHPVHVNGTTVIREQWRLETFARGTSGEMVPLPDVDFERQLVVGVFYGGSLHYGCGGPIEVVRAVRASGDALVVEIGPLPDLGPCRGNVYPAEMVVVDAASRDVRFVGDVPG